jgi:hypothetical protein
MPASRAMRATAPHSHGASSLPPASRSCAMEAFISSGSASAAFIRVSMKSSASLMPRARPTVQVSRIACSISRRRSGSARTMPSGARETAVALESATRKQNFSQFERTMSSDISALTFACFKTDKNPFATGRCDSMSGPNCSRAIWPMCSITPGREMREAM